MEGKSILITGCSSGIGLCAANLLKARGYRVFATARKKADVEQLKTQGFESLPLDVTDPNSMQQAIDQILTLTGGRLDAVFNNAGFVQSGAIEDLTWAMHEAQFATNVFGPMELTRLVLPIMRQQGHGRIIQNSSILGIVTIPWSGAYNASKFALEGYSNTLRQELRGTNIFVSILNPGPIQSKLREHAFENYQTTLKSQTANSAHLKVYERLETSYFLNKNEKIAYSPELVVKKLIHALESKRPRAHYYIGLPAHLLAFLRRILPDWALDKIVSKVR